MVSRLFLAYVVIELAAVVALAWTIGIGWTLLILLVTFVGGIAVAGSQVKRYLARLRSPDALTDGVLVALGAVLVVVPGLVSTVAGLLLLLPATRAVARPLVAALAARGVGRPLVILTTLAEQRSRSAQRDVIDGEVLDVTDVGPPAQPRPNP
ncbi:FxsA family protein [Mycobacterium noviomagense]|uniref:Membrane protein FxsA n=1 Tax=Mycobacterium noviomagense TaxID=459858 RepID=A0A7I7PK96_9MYCO|nr:FxsA family protein [Mycobacterium noviomagense]ORB15347.1 membrane protein FxsA [Mycobacterium noviomagense]BBY08985.1 membrane protein FxsA [Mycobacterium noviomagense]